jgi:hypothetical protein
MEKDKWEFMEGLDSFRMRYRLDVFPFPSPA